MSWFSRLFGAEKRNSLENPAISVSDGEAWRAFFNQTGATSGASGIYVTAETALGIAAYWCGLNFMADAMASLPLEVFRLKADDKREKLRNDPAYRLINAAPHPDLTAFDWRRDQTVDFYSHGAAYSWIERKPNGDPAAIWPLDSQRVVRELRRNGERLYHYSGPDRMWTYPSEDVIDWVWMRRRTWVDHVDPVAKFRESFGNAIAADRHAGRHFAGGGVLPWILTGPFSNGQTASRARADVDAAIKRQAQEKDIPVLALPMGHDLKTIGAAPMQSQLVEMQRFAIGQAARFFGIPPAALQDYADSKFAQAEQQDLAIVKHSLRPRLVQVQQLLDFRLWRNPRGRYVKHDLDDMLMGDFKTRAEGKARMVMAGIMTPNEARESENLEALPDGEKLYMQGAMVPINMAGQHLPGAAPALTDQTGG